MENVTVTSPFHDTEVTFTLLVFFTIIIHQKSSVLIKTYPTAKTTSTSQTRVFFPQNIVSSTWPIKSKKSHHRHCGAVRSALPHPQKKKTPKKPNHHFFSSSSSVLRRLSSVPIIISGDFISYLPLFFLPIYLKIPKKKPNKFSGFVKLSVFFNLIFSRVLILIFLY